ncbi:MAG: prepilin-type N-terminal cleavage/methylation domain-containing protein [Anaerovoracaceae bacterium]
MKNQKGFTLIEIIIAMTIAGIFAVAAIAVVDPAFKAYEKIDSGTKAQMIAETLIDEMSNKASFSKSLTATKGNGQGAVQTDKGTIQVSNEGYLMIGDKLAFADEFYDGKMVAMKTDQAGSNQVKVSLSVIQGGKSLYTLDSTLKPISESGNSRDKYTPEGMLALANETKNMTDEELKKYSSNNNSGYGYGKNNLLFAAIFIGGYEKNFPAYSADKVISPDVIDKVYNTADNAKPRDWQTANWVKAWREPTYLACFITANTLVPIVYLTSQPASFNTQSHSSVLGLYYEGIWYRRSNWQTGYMMTQFNNNTTEQIRAKLDADWTAI